MRGRVDLSHGARWSTLPSLSASAVSSAPTQIQAEIFAKGPLNISLDTHANLKGR